MYKDTLIARAAEVALSAGMVALSVSSGGNGGTIPRGFGSLALASDMKVGWGLVTMLG